MRGLRELRPRRLSYAKLAASVMRQTWPGRSSSLAGSVLMMPFGGDEPEQVARFLPDMEHVTIGPPSLAALRKCITTCEDELHLVVAGDAEGRADDSQGFFARALVSHDRRVELDLARKLLTVSKQRQRPQNQQLVVDERAGKAMVLALEDPTIRQNIKRWQTLLSKDQRDRPACDTPPGWGIAAKVLSPASKVEAGETFSYASLDLVFTNPRFGWEVAQGIRRAADVWMRPFDLRPLRTLTVCSPWLATSAFIASPFLTEQTNSPELLLPDQIFGWQPLISFVDFLSPSAGPSLLIDTGSYPLVHLGLVWP